MEVEVEVEDILGMVEEVAPIQGGVDLDLVEAEMGLGAEAEEMRVGAEVV